MKPLPTLILSLIVSVGMAGCSQSENRKDVYADKLSKWQTECAKLQQLAVKKHSHKLLDSAEMALDSAFKYYHLKYSTK